MKNVLLTGATGYLGSFLTRKIISDGLKILTAGRNNADIHVDFGADFLSEDVIQHIKDVNCDTLIHAAAANEVICRNKPIDSYNINVSGTRLALELAQKAGINNFIYVSTFHVYANLSGLIDEGVHPTPGNDYGMTHYLSEQIVKMYAQQYGMTTLVVRPSNIYQAAWNSCTRWSLVPLCFCKQLVEEHRIVLHSSGIQERNFVYVGDVWNDIKENFGDVPLIHCFGSEQLSIKDVASMVIKVGETFGVNGELISPDELLDGKTKNEFKFFSKYVKDERSNMLEECIRDTFKVLL